MNTYYKNILGQILQGEQPKLEEIINLRFESGYEIEEKMVYNLEDLTITEAVLFLEENWDIFNRFCDKRTALFQIYIDNYIDIL